MNGPRDYHITRRKSDKEQQKAYEITYWSNLQTDKNELSHKTKSGSRDLALTLLATKGKGGWIN